MAKSIASADGNQAVQWSAPLLPPQTSFDKRVPDFHESP
jgi:hypothetical protein